MIIVLLILATFVFAGAMIFARAGRTRVLTTLISGLIIAGGLGALILNDNYHWGMHQVTQTQIQDLAPLQSKRAALRVQQLGTGSERVIAYRVASATKASRTVAATTTTTKLTTGSACSSSDQNDHLAVQKPLGARSLQPWQYQD